MKKFIKELASVEIDEVRDWMYEYELYAKKGQKYCEWDFFMFIFIPFFRRRIATEDVYVDKYESLPNKSQIYTVSELEQKHYVVDDNNVVKRMATVYVNFLDGSDIRYYFKSNDEANNFAKNIIEEYGLKEWNKSAE